MRELHADVEIYKDYILIKDSYKITDSADMYRVLRNIMNNPAYDEFGYKRKMSNYIAEWKVHNWCYKLGIQRARTADVNLDREFSNSKSSKLQKIVYDILDGFWNFYDEMLAQDPKYNKNKK